MMCWRAPDVWRLLGRLGPSETQRQARAAWGCFGRPDLQGEGSLLTVAETKRATRWVTLFVLVEAAGVEPASASTLPLALHA